MSIYFHCRCVSLCSILAIYSKGEALLLCGGSYIEVGGPPEDQEQPEDQEEDGDQVQVPVQLQRVPRLRSCSIRIILSTISAINQSSRVIFLHMYRIYHIGYIVRRANNKIDTILCANISPPPPTESFMSYSPSPFTDPGRQQ